MARRLCFQSNQAGERGTEIAMYDYADFAEKLWNYESYIIFPNYTQRHTNMIALPKFQKRFNTTVYQEPGEDLTTVVRNLKCELIYIIKAGIRFGEPSLHSIRTMPCPTAIHAVFFWEPHGSAYAAISPDVTHYRENRAVVHHIVRPVDMDRFNARKGMREVLNISTSTLTVCRYGGKDSFDLDFAQDAVITLAQRHPPNRLQFIFVNTFPFPIINNTHISHPQVLFLPALLDADEKEEFIRTCDVMVHGRRMGETFGLAIAEFSVHNKPVVTYPGKSQFHVKTLGDRGFFYRSGPQLIQIIEGFLEKGIPIRDYNAYRAYEPEKVMQEFKKYFLDPFFNSTR